ncbi:lysine biosynthesis protein LysW [Candidatus Bipolaricaulota bacterium]|nr:lysine biosynthesis protein LysW [Candidatus Bipolaricaulota bacterium]MCK4599569.1 lysine biosynthesis protein LysW [Candidatus Bipolaricaulota bacterium]
MPTIICPLCDARVEIEQEDAILCSQMRCPECSVLLEITGEDPLTVEWISEEWDYGDSFSDGLSQKLDRARKFTKQKR